MNIKFRKGNEKDAEGVVKVITYSWMTTYKDLLPKEILEDRLKTIDERISKMADSIRRKDNLYVVTDDDKIVGMLTYGQSRNEKYPDSGEINAIYLLDEYQGMGIGKKLFMIGIKSLIDNGYNSMILNVLDGNKTFNFYEKYGGKKVDTKEEMFGNNKSVLNIMYFEDLNEIYSKFSEEYDEQKANKIGGNL